MAKLDFCKSLLYLVYTQGIARFSYLPLHSLLQPSWGFTHAVGEEEDLCGYLVNTGVFLDTTL